MICMPGIDLNCDMGESTALYAYDIERDLCMLEYVSSVNLACGFHAGDASTMHRLVSAALSRNIGIGAHPSYPDRDNFGRMAMPMPPDAIYDIVLYQLGALQAFLQVRQARLQHVKPHGALYNLAAANRPVADAISRAVRDYDKGLILYGLSGSELVTSAKRLGLATASEVFADRTYLENGTLTPRALSNALIADEAVVVKQVLQMVKEGTVTAGTGTVIGIEAGTICLHGDGPHALQFAKAIYNALVENDVSIQKPG